MRDNTPNRTFDKTRELTEKNYLGIDDAISSAIICVDEIFNDCQFFVPDTKAAEYWNKVRDFLIKALSY